MNELFSGVGIRPFDFIQITAAFVLTMLLFFRVKGERRFWPNFMLLTFGLQCMFFIIFHDGLGFKTFCWAYADVDFNSGSLGNEEEKTRSPQQARCWMIQNRRLYCC